MATNLRLRPDAEEALRARAAASGESQQELIRQAVDRYLGLREAAAPESPVEVAMTVLGVLPARTKFRELDELVRLPEGTNTVDLLERDERF
ncbi:ribbon-helix-helix protein, CopG family [Saxibacter everestensis]|uniref:Ribbon-helix-helix protein, CopG family n=1 Tax=Saxibacter everestensis TaxID=2909229 RepID=A0ABY8QTA8_9MICO|nr:ribbon-helix-helix protein, CopG family [Brevibacteriaceae bacterium ZFBP1038]